MCNCESSYCSHTHEGDTRCGNVADGSIRMEYVGTVCADCASTTESTDYGRNLITRTEDHCNV